MKDHLELADARSSSPEITLSLKAVNLKLQQDALLKEGADAGAGVVASVLGGEKTGFPPMPAWRELRKGKSWIRVIDDPAELERLCNRNAPGAGLRLSWNSSMARCCGKFYVVKANRSDLKGYVIENPDCGNNWLFPFNAVSLAAY